MRFLDYSLLLKCMKEALTLVFAADDFCLKMSLLDFFFKVKPANQVHIWKAQ